MRPDSLAKVLPRNCFAKLKTNSLPNVLQIIMMAINFTLKCVESKHTKKANKRLSRKSESNLDLIRLAD